MPLLRGNLSQPAVSLNHEHRGLLVQITSPCSVSWGAMSGRERVRFCGICRQSVYNVEALSHDEAEPS